MNSSSEDENNNSYIDKGRKKTRDEGSWERNKKKRARNVSGVLYYYNVSLDT
jgi:hypothetical protein